MSLPPPPKPVPVLRAGSLGPPPPGRVGTGSLGLPPPVVVKPLATASASAGAAAATGTPSTPTGAGNGVSPLLTGEWIEPAGGRRTSASVSYTPGKPLIAAGGAASTPGSAATDASVVASPPPKPVDRVRSASTFAGPPPPLPPPLPSTPKAQAAPTTPTGAATPKTALPTPPAVPAVRSSVIIARSAASTSAPPLPANGTPAKPATATPGVATVGEAGAVQQPTRATAQSVSVTSTPAPATSPPSVGFGKLGPPPPASPNNAATAKPPVAAAVPVSPTAAATITGVTSPAAAKPAVGPPPPIRRIFIPPPRFAPPPTSLLGAAPSTAGTGGPTNAAAVTAAASAALAMVRAAAATAATATATATPAATPATTATANATPPVGLGPVPIGPRSLSSPNSVGGTVASTTTTGASVPSSPTPATTAAVAGTPARTGFARPAAFAAAVTPQRGSTIEAPPPPASSAPTVDIPAPPGLAGLPSPPPPPPPAGDAAAADEEPDSDEDTAAANGAPPPPPAPVTPKAASSPAAAPAVTAAPATPVTVTATPVTVTAARLSVSAASPPAAATTAAGGRLSVSGFRPPMASAAPVTVTAVPVTIKTITATVLAPPPPAGNGNGKPPADDDLPPPPPDDGSYVEVEDSGDETAEEDDTGDAPGPPGGEKGSDDDQSDGGDDTESDESTEEEVDDVGDEAPPPPDDLPPPPPEDDGGGHKSSGKKHRQATFTAGMDVTAATAAPPPGAFAGVKKRGANVARPSLMAGDQVKLLAKLTNLAWHVFPSPLPNLTFAVASTNWVHRSMSDPLFRINLKFKTAEATTATASGGSATLAPATSTSGVIPPNGSVEWKSVFAGSKLELYDNEVCIKSVLLTEVVDVGQSTERPTTVNLTYTSVPQKMLMIGDEAPDDAAAASTAPVDESDKMLLSCSITCLSVSDATDIAYLLKAIVAGRFAKFEAGQICIHKGYVKRAEIEMKAGPPTALTTAAIASFGPMIGWRRTYVRLVKNRLICYQSAESELPYAVWCLNEATTVSSVVGLTPDTDIVLTATPSFYGSTGAGAGQSLSSVLPVRWVLRTDSAVEREKWDRALREEKTFSQTLENLCYGDVKKVKKVLPPPPAAGDAFRKPALGKAQDETDASTRKAGGSSFGTLPKDFGATMKAMAAEQAAAGADGKTDPSKPDAKTDSKDGKTVKPSARVIPNMNTGKTPTVGGKKPIPNMKSIGNKASIGFDADSLAGDKKGDKKHNAHASVSGLNLHLTEEDDSAEARDPQLCFGPQKLSLVTLARNQQVFFEFLKKFKDMKCFFVTEVATVADWVKATPSSKLFGYRGGGHAKLDKAIKKHQRCVKLCKTALKTSRMTCLDSGTNAAASQIGFAFPGFDSQVFDVGQCAVVSPWQFFSVNGKLAFQAHDWQGALQSLCVAKELMQSSPDVSSYYDQGKAKEAQGVMFKATKRVLHNVFLATYLRQANSNQTFREGDEIKWETVAALPVFEKAGNRKHLESWNSVVYMYNPTIERFKKLITTKVKEDKNAPKDKPKLRLLFDPVHFLRAMHLIVSERIASCDRLMLAIGAFQRDTTLYVKGTPIVDAVTGLLRSVSRDQAECRAALADLPKLDHCARFDTVIAKRGIALAAAKVERDQKAGGGGGMSASSSATAVSVKK